MTGVPTQERPRLTLDDLARLHRTGTPIVMATAYDFVSGSAADAAGVDLVLVGDSAATVMLGLATTREVSLEEMLVLTRAARRGVTRALVVGDLPFGTYETSDALAVATARRFAEIGCDLVKMEGAGPIADRVKAVVATGLPVMGHVGLRPQQLQPGEPARVPVRTADAAVMLLRDARALEAAGCKAIVLEAVPAVVAERVVSRLRVPVIGIGAGASPAGQVLVTYDLLGLTEGHIPRFVKQYASLKREMVDAIAAYAADVRLRRFPESRHEYGLDATELAELDRRLATDV
jgi:3-methyl-2-oxobutanoate hydroxymethyltransferase